MFYLSYSPIVCKSRQKQPITHHNTYITTYQRANNQCHTMEHKKGSTFSAFAPYLFHDYLLPKRQNGPTFLAKTSGGISLMVMSQCLYVPIVRIAGQSLWRQTLFPTTPCINIMPMHFYTIMQRAANKRPDLHYYI